MLLRSVLCLSAAMALMAPVWAQAQDFTPTSDRILSDPSYLPLKGQFLGQSGYEYGWTSGNTSNTSGRLVNSSGHSNTFSQSVTYGLTDALSVNVGLSYQSDRNHQTYLTSGDYKSSGPRGFEDPSFGFTYRAIDQRNHPASLDVFADYSPDVFPNRVPSTYGGGTVARGGDAVDFGLKLSRETRFFTIQGVFSENYVGGRQAFNQTSGGTTNLSGYWSPTLAVNTQTRLNDRLSVNAGLDYTFTGNTNVSNNLTNLNYQETQGDYAGLNLAVNYHFIPNTLVGSLNYRHTFYDHSNTIFADDPSSNTEIQRTGDTVGGTLRYVFK